MNLIIKINVNNTIKDILDGEKKLKENGVNCTFEPEECVISIIGLEKRICIDDMLGLIKDIGTLYIEEPDINKTIKRMFSK